MNNLLLYTVPHRYLNFAWNIYVATAFRVYKETPPKDKFEQRQKVLVLDKNSCLAKKTIDIYSRF